MSNTRRLSIKNQSAFTLIELLVVVAIVGILSSIAIGHFQLYRKRSFDAGAKSDLHNAASAEEAYYIDQNAYFTCANAGLCIAGLTGLKSTSPSVELAMQGTTSSFTGTASATSGAGVTYTWDSSAGGMQ